MIDVFNFFIISKKKLKIFYLCLMDFLKLILNFRNKKIKNILCMYDD